MLKVFRRVMLSVQKHEQNYREQMMGIFLQSVIIVDRFITLKNQHLKKEKGIFVVGSVIRCIGLKLCRPKNKTHSARVTRQKNENGVKKPGNN